MKAHTRLWIDHRGILVDAPPSTGYLVAMNGQDVPQRFIDAYGLEMMDGKVVQRGKEAETPKSTPDALIADRDLFVTRKGELVDEKPEDGIFITEKGAKVITEYVNAYNLEEQDGRIVQKEMPPAKNKKMGRPKTKAAK